MVNRYEKVTSLIWLMASAAIIAKSAKCSVSYWSHLWPVFLPMLCGIAMAAFSLIVK
jgi:hypothetical protein